MTFLAGFSLCSAVVQECMMGSGEGAIHSCLNSTLTYSVDQFQQGFREKRGGKVRGRRRAGAGHQTFLFLVDIFKIMK